MRDLLVPARPFAAIPPRHVNPAHPLPAATPRLVVQWALIKGDLRCDAKVLGAPAWDPDLNTADLPLPMRIDELPARYRKHFLVV